MRKTSELLMTPAKWATIPDNPIQRDTEAHARKAKHLREPHDTHRKVEMAELPDGRRYKIDGHTRSYLWAKGDLEAPDMVEVTVWHLDNLQEVKEFYGTRDNRAAVDTTPDQIYGAVRDLKLTFNSNLLKSNNFASALTFASDLLYGTSARKTPYEGVKAWRAELELLDRCNPSRKVFYAALVTAALLIFRRYGESALEFWTRYADGKGIQDEESFDAVHALLDKVKEYKGNRKLGGAGNVEEIVSLAIPAFKKYQSGERYLPKRTVNGTRRPATGIKMMDAKWFDARKKGVLTLDMKKDEFHAWRDKTITLHKDRLRLAEIDDFLTHYNDSMGPAERAGYIGERKRLYERQRLGGERH